MNDLWVYKFFIFFFVIFILLLFFNKWKITFYILFCMLFPRLTECTFTRVCGWICVKNWWSEFIFLYDWVIMRWFFTYRSEPRGFLFHTSWWYEKQLVAVLIVIASFAILALEAVFSVMKWWSRPNIMTIAAIVSRRISGRPCLSFRLTLTTIPPWHPVHYS